MQGMNCGIKPTPAGFSQARVAVIFKTRTGLKMR